MLILYRFSLEYFVRAPVRARSFEGNNYMQYVLNLVERAVTMTLDREQSFTDPHLVFYLFNVWLYLESSLWVLLVLELMVLVRKTVFSRAFIKCIFYKFPLIGMKIIIRINPYITFSITKHCFLLLNGCFGLSWSDKYIIYYYFNLFQSDGVEIRFGIIHILPTFL